jgi:hypothetical protein
MLTIGGTHTRLENRKKVKTMVLLGECPAAAAADNKQSLIPAIACWVPRMAIAAAGDCM